MIRVSDRQRDVMNVMVEPIQVPVIAGILDLTIEQVAATMRRLEQRRYVFRYGKARYWRLTHKGLRFAGK